MKKMAEILEKGHEHENYEEKRDSQNVESDSQNQYSSDSQNRESSESPPYDVDSLPQSASSWRRETIEEMKINIDESTYSSSDPVVFITEKLLKVIFMMCCSQTASRTPKPNVRLSIVNPGARRFVP